jgi:outer membrane murein-binding lipoprotein Lpp
MKNIIKTIAVGLVLTGCASHPKLSDAASVVEDYSG